MTERNDEGVLQRLLTGDLDPASSEARELFERDPSATAKLAELRRLGEELEQLYGEEGAVLRDAGERREAPGLARVESTLSRLGSNEPQLAHAAPVGVRLLRLVVALAALVLIVFAARRFTSRGNEPQGEHLLGGSDIEIETAAGPLAEYATFRWSGSLPPGGRFAIRVVDATPDGAGHVLVPEFGSLDHTWTPPPSAASWPNRIRLEIQALDASRNEVAYGEAEFSRAGS